MAGKRREKRRLGSVDYSLQRIQAEHKDHVWSCDFVSDKTEDGRQLRLLSIVDEYTHESLSLEVDHGRGRGTDPAVSVSGSGPAEVHSQQQRTGVRGQDGASMAGAA